MMQNKHRFRHDPKAKLIECLEEALILNQKVAIIMPN